MHSNLEEISDPVRLLAVKSVARRIENLNESFEGLTRILAYLLGAPIAAFALVDQNRQIIQGAFGFSVRETSATEGVFCRVCVARDDLLIVSDAMKDDRFADSPLVTGPQHLRFYAGVPVHAPNGRAVGTLCIADTKSRELTMEHAATLLRFRENLEEIILVRTLPARHELTCVYKRDDFAGILEREWRRAELGEEPIAVLLIDLDYLEAYNEQYGQPEGDRVLKATTRAIKTCFRRTGEVVARYEGRFVVLVPGADETTAQRLAERCRAAVAALSIEHAASPFGVVTISIGAAAEVPHHQKLAGPVALVERADWLLDVAKATGRNRTAASIALIH